MKRLLMMLCALMMSYVATAQDVAIMTSGGPIELPGGCRQVVVVENSSTTNAQVYLLTLSDDSSWSGSSMSGVIGYGGLADVGTKREGDGKTPVGVFALRRGLCYVKDFTTSFPMELYNEEYMWDENPQRATYNTLVRNPEPGTDGDRLWARRELQYRYIVVVEYNTSPVVSGMGSAIFIHAWRAEGKPTAGCVGMSESNMKRLVEWLKPELNPHIAIMDKGVSLKTDISQNNE